MSGADRHDLAERHRPVACRRQPNDWHTGIPRLVTAFQIRGVDDRGRTEGRTPQSNRRWVGTARSAAAMHFDSIEAFAWLDEVDPLHLCIALDERHSPSGLVSSRMPSTAAV